MPPATVLCAELVAPVVEPPVAEAVGALEVVEPLAPEELEPVGSVSLAFLNPPMLGPEVMPVPFLQTSGVGVPEVKVMSAHYDSMSAKR